MKRLFRHGLLLATLILGSIFQLAAQSTQMTIYMNDGTEHTYNMAENDRFYFEDNERLVVEIQANSKSERYNLADIRKIMCNETEGIEEASSTSICLSPNPVHDAFMLRNLEGIQNIFIYSLDGQLMKSLEVTGDQLIDIVDFPVGIYLVKTQSSTHKIIKL